MRRLIALALFSVWFAAAYAQDQPPPQDGQLTVVVKDEQGNAVAGAKVICASTNHSTIPDPLSEPLQGVTDAEGHCQFGPLPRMAHYILARTDTHGAWGRADLYQGGTVTAELTLKRGLSRTVTVEDAQGKPMPGVELVYGMGLLLGRTDEKGQFVLPNLDPNGSYEIIFLKESLGYVSETYWLNAGRTNVTMAPGATIEGTVKNSEGQPVSGVTVSGSPFEVRSDEQGRFRLGLFPTDRRRMQIIAQSQNGDPYLWGQQEVDVRPGTNTIDLIVSAPDTAKAQQEAAVVEGKVVMKDTGEGVRSTVFYTYNNGPESWNSPSWKATERDGTFRLEGLSGDGRIFLAVEPDRKTLYCSSGVVPVELKKGQTVKDVVMTVDEGCAISGKVLDTDGKGVAAEIRIEPANALPRPNRSHETGTFIIANLDKPDQSYTLTFLPMNGSQSVQHKVAAVGKGQYGQVEVTIEAPAAAGKLRGLVVDVQGQPVAGAQIALNPEGNSSMGVTDDEGRFETDFRVREAKRVPLHVYVQKQVYLGNRQVPIGPDVEIVSGGEVNLEPGKTLDAERVVLKLTPHRYMSGQVTDPSGAKVNAQITALSTESGESDYANDGMFVLRKLPEAPYVIEVTAQGYRARILEPGRDYPAEAEEIRVTLQKGPFAENSSVFSQVTGREESIEVIDSLPAGRLIHDRCRTTYPAMAGNKVQGAPID